MLRHEARAKRWSEVLPVGNGRIGTMDFVGANGEGAERSTIPLPPTVIFPCHAGDESDWRKHSRLVPAAFGREGLLLLGRFPS